MLLLTVLQHALCTAAFALLLGAQSTYCWLCLKLEVLNQDQNLVSCSLCRFFFCEIDSIDHFFPMVPKSSVEDMLRASGSYSRIDFVIPTAPMCFMCLGCWERVACPAPHNVISCKKSVWSYLGAAYLVTVLGNPVRQNDTLDTLESRGCFLSTARISRNSVVLLLDIKAQSAA